MGVSTDLERGWSTQQNLFLSFLICEADWYVFRIVVFLYSKFILSIFDWPSSRIVARIFWNMRTVWKCWMDLELCTGDGCKYWPRKGLVHPAKSLPELLDLWSKDWFYFNIVFFVTRISFFVFLICLVFKQYNFSIQFSTVNVKTYKTCFGTRTGSICWIDLELCTGDGCKYWPRKGLVHPAKSLPELLDLWSKDWSYFNIAFFCYSNSFFVFLICLAFEQ